MTFEDDPTPNGSISARASAVAHAFGDALTEIRGYAELLLARLEPDSPLWAEADAIRDAAERASSLPKELLALAPGHARPTAERPTTVLLAEDEAAVRTMLVSVLESAGFRVIGGANGEEALAAAAAEPGRIDVLVTDVVMPGMDGVELAERLAPTRPSVRVVYVSGHTQHPTLEEGVRLGTVELLRKPFSIHALIGRVRALAAEAQADDFTCVVADAHPPVLDSVVRFLETRGMTVVAATTSGPATLAAIEELRPRVALVDVAMPGFDGIELVRRLAEISSDTRIALYSGAIDPRVAAEALDAGAHGVVLKHADLEEVLRAVELLAAGGVYVDAALAAALVNAQPAEPRAALTEREREVLALVARGLTNDRIAGELGISAETVQTHVRNAMTKLGAGTRTEAVASALRAELIG